MKRGYLDRSEDVSNISGTGNIAEVAISSDGRVAVFWPPPNQSVASFPDLETVKRVHGHNGKTVVVILDEYTEDHSHCKVCHSDAFCLDHDNICKACMENI